MRLLELFCGTKSVSKAVGHLFDEVVNVDIESKFNPTFCADILTWDYTIYPPGHFDAVWASPPCQEYSCLNFARPDKVPNLALADSLVARAIKIIEYFNPGMWFIENPQSGGLKDREVVAGLPYVDFDYCCFSNWGYRKRTRIWTAEDLPTTLCKGEGLCPNMEGKKHKNAIGNHYHAREYWVEKGKRLEQRYSIPENLITHLFSSLSGAPLLEHASEPLPSL